jgi:hypothetical protein
MAYAPHSKENSNLQHQQQPTKTTAQAFADERESTTAISPLQAMMANNAQQQKLKSTAQLMANSPAQQNLNTTAQSFANQPESIQRMEDEEPLQGEFESEPAQLEAAEALRPNNTGLPDNLKSGIESLSGMSMDHVKVHYNSDKPAQLQAHAYAQGSEIHVAPGQEQHLPHEAWHVVQQAQGRVRPTMQMKAGIGVNDDVGLEQEADVMGAMAIQTVVSNNLLGKPASPALNHTPLQMVACSGGYLAGIFNENNVMNLRVRIGEAAFQHFMTLETNVFSPMVDVFLNQTPILNAAGQVAFLTPLIGNPVQLALAFDALQRAVYNPVNAPAFFAYLLHYHNLGAVPLATARGILTAEAGDIPVAHYIYKYTAISPRVLAVARTKLGLAGNNAINAEQAMQAVAPYDYYTSVKAGADNMAGAIASTEIGNEQAVAVQQDIAFRAAYQTSIGMPITTAFTAHTAHQREAPFQVLFPNEDLGNGNGGAKRNIMNGIRLAKIAELNGANAAIGAQLPARTALKSANIQPRLLPLYALPDAEANANWCLAQAGQDTALLTTCVEIMVAVGGHAVLRDRFNPLPHAQKHALLSILSSTLGGQLNAGAISGLLDLLVPLNIAAVNALILLLNATLDSQGIDNLILNLNPSDGTAIDTFVRAHVPAITAAQLAELVHLMRPLTLADIGLYIGVLLVGLNRPQIHALTVVMNPARAAIGTEIKHLADTLCTTIPTPLSNLQFRTLVLGLDGLPGNEIDAMVTKFIALGMNHGVNISTRIQNLRGSLIAGGNESTSVTALDGERIRSGAQIADHVGQVAAEGDMLLYPRSGINPVGRAETLLWEDCDATVHRHATETATDIMMRQQMALNAIISLGGVNRQIAQRVFVEQNGQHPRAMGTGAAEDVISNTAGNAGHIAARHVIGGGGVVSNLVHLQARADGNPAYPPCPGIAGAFANAGASQAGMHNAIQAANWINLRRDMIRGLTCYITQAVAVNGHVARNGLPMNNAPTRVYAQVTGANVNGGFYCFHSYPMP